MKSQRQEIKEHLESGRSITPIEALNLYGCFRLSGRIYELREQGMNISKVMAEASNGKKFAKYKLIKP